MQTKFNQDAYIYIDEKIMDLIDILERGGRKLGRNMCLGSR
jgi:hypothetical protein